MTNRAIARKHSTPKRRSWTNEPADSDCDHTLHLLTREFLAARTRVRMTQEDVAWRMGTTRSAISRLEGAHGHRPSFATIEKYAAAVGCYVQIRLRPVPVE